MFTAYSPRCECSQPIPRSAARPCGGSEIARDRGVNVHSQFPERQRDIQKRDIRTYGRRERLNRLQSWYTTFTRITHTLNTMAGTARGRFRSCDMPTVSLKLHGGCGELGARGWARRMVVACSDRAICRDSRTPPSRTVVVCKEGVGETKPFRQVSAFLCGRPRGRPHAPSHGDAPALPPPSRWAHAAAR